ncbi:ABC transporter ATP-binding protein [Kineococcus sp. LSe6-4]|uniref:ABC transporter ATP-binding protein n=1 Tax=Kineococcus halophytocola TaxID=3234027 RepID=A0ABV4H3K9_9ACTN
MVAQRRVDPVHLQVESRRGRSRPAALPHWVRRAWGTCWAAGPRDLLATLVPQFVTAVVLAALLPLVRTLLHVLTTETADGERLARAAVPLLLLALVGLAVGMAGAVQGQRQKVLGEVVQRHVWSRFLDVSARVDLAHYDSPEFFERLERVRLHAMTRPLAVVQGLVSVAGGAVGLVAVVVAVWAVAPVALVLLAPVPVLLLIARRGGRQEFEFAVRHAPALRLRSYLQSTLTDRGTASEVRSYGLQSHLRGRWDATSDEWIGAVREHSRRRTRTILAGELVTALVAVGLLVAVVAALDTGRLTFSQAGAVGVAVPLLAARSRQFVRGVGAVLESGLFLDDLDEFHSTPVEPDAHDAPAVGPLEVLRARDVSFRFSSGARALRGIDLDLRAGEVVALVGENGSGKSTLAKVLAGLHRPTGGLLTWNGLDVAELPAAAVRRRVAVMFQDFAHWQLSAVDNIAFGDVDRAYGRGGPPDVEDAAREAGAWEFLRGLPAGLDTPLSAERPGGTELSGGQWQRVALARALYRGGDLLILDEPSAALDARAEAELFATVRAATRGRAVLLITHRLANVRDVDRIHVLRDGLVDDVGTHEELLRRGGHYAALYELQARAFRSGRAPVADDAGPRTDAPGTKGWWR